MFGGKSYPSCEVTPSLCLPRQFPFFRQRKCQGQGGQQLDWDITHSSWKCQLRNNFTFALWKSCQTKNLSSVCQMFSAPISFSLQYFPVSIAPARPFQCWCLVHSIMFPGYPGSCIPVSAWIVFPCVSLLLCSGGGSHWNSVCWKLSRCKKRPAGLEEVLVCTWERAAIRSHNNFPDKSHLSLIQPPMTGRTKIRHKARTRIKQMVISNKTSGSG